MSNQQQRQNYSRTNIKDKLMMCCLFCFFLFSSFFPCFVANL